MTQFRIIKAEALKTNSVYFVAQYKNWLHMWKDIEYFYKPEIEDMPGWITAVCPSIAQAHQVLRDFKRDNSFFESVVYTENAKDA